MTIDGLREIGAKHQAERYARAISAAAAAEERIGALEEVLKEAEYFRMLAETQLDAAIWPDGVGRVFHIGTEEPGEDVHALLDLYSGQVWQRENQYWYQADKAGPTTRYEWPLGDTGGPYIRLRDDWHINQLTEAARDANEQRTKIERELRHKPGYLPEGSSAWTQVPLARGVIGAYHNLQTRHENAKTDLSNAQNALENANWEIRGLKRRIAEYEQNEETN